MVVSHGLANSYPYRGFEAIKVWISANRLSEGKTQEKSVESGLYPSYFSDKSRNFRHLFNLTSVPGDSSNANGIQSNLI